MMNTPFYGADLAIIHDEGYSSFVDHATPNILRMIRKHGIRKGRVLDLGCGSGVFAAAARKAGHRVSGIDISQEMIRLARKRVPRATFTCDSILSSRFSASDVITAIGEPFNYITEKNALPRVFRKAYRALSPGGMLLFDLALPGRKMKFTAHHKLGKNWACVALSTEDPKRGTLVRRITTFRKKGKGFRRQDEIHQQCLYPSTQVMHWLRSEGFRAVRRKSYGPFVLPGNRNSYLAIK